MRTIAVIGLTNLGVTLARLLAATNRVDRLVFLDQDDQIAVGLAADLAASPAPHCEVVIQDPAALKAADVLVVTIGQRFLGQPDAFAQLAGNVQAIQEWRSAVTESGFSGVVLNLATPNEALTGLIQQEWQLPVQRVLGTGTITDTARLHQVVAAAVEQPTSSVTGYMLGQHDGNLVPIWSSVRVNGRSIEEPINGHSLDTAKLLVDVRGVPGVDDGRQGQLHSVLVGVGDPGCFITKREHRAASCGLSASVSVLHVLPGPNYPGGGGPVLVAPLVPG